MSAEQEQPTMSDPEKPVCTFFRSMCAFRKDGSPVVGNLGATVRDVVIIEIKEWKKLMEAVPELKTTKFNVGTKE